VTRLAAGLLVLLLASTARAEPPPASAGLPPGHPPVGLSPGAGRPEIDRIEPDPSLPAGTIAVQVVDGDGEPVAGVDLALQMVRHGATDEGRRASLPARSDGRGQHRFDGMPTGAGVVYRVVATRSGAVYGSQAFGLDERPGVRLLTHAYAPVTDLRRAALAMEAFVVLDIEEDAIAVHHLLRALNVGKNAFLATGLRLPLPSDARAFALAEHSEGVSASEQGGAVLLTGTFPPGQIEIGYRYEVPRGRSERRRLRVGLPPRVVFTTVLTRAGAGVGLEVAGFGQASRELDAEGRRVLRVARQLDLSRGLEVVVDDTEPTTLDINLSGLPVPGPARLVALALAALGVAIGLAAALGRTQRGAHAGTQRDLCAARDTLLDELVALERAHQAGRIEPDRYAPLRAALLDALARILGRLE
jgi:hypothetical protein